MRIPRVFQKIFGSTAGSQQVGQFGSFANGSPTYATDAATIMGLSNWLQGWFAAVVGANSPAIQDMNGAFLAVTQQLAEIFQDGIPPWDSQTVYYKGSLATASTGVSYVSLTDSNSNQPLTDTSNWWPMTSPSVPQVTVGTQAFCNYSSIAAAVADSALGEDVTVFVTSDQTLNATVNLTKARWRIVSMPGVSIIAGSATTGFSCQASGIQFRDCTFVNFASAVAGNSSWTYGRVLFSTFTNCTSEVDDTNSPAGTKPVTLGNFSV